MRYSAEITIPFLPKMTNAQSRNWRAINAERKKVKSAVKEQLGKNIPNAPVKHAKLTCIRHSSICPDYDGIVSGFKSVIDGIVEARVLEDDSMDNIGMPSFKWERARKGSGSVTVFIEEIA